MTSVTKWRSSCLLLLKTIQLFHQQRQRKPETLCLGLGTLFSSEMWCYTGRFIIFSIITTIYNTKSQRTYLNGIFHSHSKSEKIFLTTTDVRCVPSGTDHYSSEAYRWTHVDACVARTWISYLCVPCQPWCTHQTILIIKKTFSVFLWLWTFPLR
jgi:hypothetical protein